DRHLEFFVESWNALTEPHTNTATDVSWDKGQATVRWDFARRAIPPRKGRTYHWRNIWGWCLRRFPEQRRRAPLRIFHYLDNFKRYPDEKVIRQVAEQGADTFILHENWRLDMANDESPYDARRLRRTIQACHRHGLRAGLYVRGNEDGIRRSFAQYMRPYLQRNWDGIYMDYGTPVCYMGVEENAPGGRIGFREYHAMTRRIREFVGPDGFHISHSGSFFSAIGHTHVDAYLGGEQEKGALLKNPTVHAYFSGLAVAPSTLWTAAFPTYRTAKILPFLASTLQAPFLHLGTQVPYSSLSHPEVPSQITFARPLWRLWELFDGLKDIRVLSSAAGGHALRTDGRFTGASVLVSRGGDALVVVANFAAGTRKVGVAVDWRAIGLEPGRHGFALNSTYEGNQFSPCSPASRLRTTLEGHGIGGWLIVRDPQVWQRKLAFFARPYADPAEDREQHARELAEIQGRRFMPSSWKNCFLRLSIPNWPNNYEDSIFFDMWDNQIELQDRTDRKNPVVLGYVSKAGLTATIPRKRDTINAGEASPWIPLDSLKRIEGRRRLGLATRRGAAEFYSLVKAEISPCPAVCADTRELKYNNDIDLDWSLLTFDILVQK
ncbi:MAG: hypothetical protein PHR35_09125, partial [Kiritimatiellae bacterium]|nr:hypothetical protein [Kiritimatiellia bacterium]